MKNHLYKLALMVTLGSSFALAQGMPQRQSLPQQPPAVPQTQQPPTGDQSKPPAASTSNIQNNIQSALQDAPSLAGSSISVLVSDKDVELLGTVPTKDAKDAAEQIAKVHSGGLSVKNNIKVTGKSPDNSGEKPKSDQPKLL